MFVALQTAEILQVFFFWKSAVRLEKLQGACVGLLGTEQSSPRPWKKYVTG